MLDLIAKTAVVLGHGQRFTTDEEKALEDRLDCLLDEIRSTSRLGAEPLLDQLGDLQTEIARACFKWGIELPKRLRQLVHDFDQSHDPELRDRTFRRIKASEFLQNQ